MCWVRAAAAPTGQESDTWVHYDDDVVGRPQAALPPTVASDAYLLFYELMPAAAREVPEAAQQAVDTPAAASADTVEDAETVGDESTNVEMEVEIPAAASPDGMEDTDATGGDMTNVEMEDAEESDGAMDTA